MYVVFSIFVAVMEERCEKRPSFFRPEFHQKALDLVLKNNHQNQQSYAHHLVENRADKLHLQNLGGHHPYENEREHTVEYVDCARFLHYLIEIIKHQGHDQNVEHIFYSE